jgi:hypothetical protein
VTDPPFTIVALVESTWPAFSTLVERGLGGGLVEGYPEPAGAVPAGFLSNGALSAYERLGFVRDRRIGKHRWVVTKVVDPAGT